MQISPGTTLVKDISGRKLAHSLKKDRVSPTFRALLAHQMERGEVSVHDFTRKQARMLVGASAGYVATLSRLPQDQIESVKRGTLSLSTLHTHKPTPTDEQVDRIVAKLGAERVLAALDRLTKPASTTPATNDNTAMDWRHRAFPFVGQHVAAAE